MPLSSLNRYKWVPLILLGSPSMLIGQTGPSPTIASVSAGTVRPDAVAGALGDASRAVPVGSATRFERNGSSSAPSGGQQQRFESPASSDVTPAQKQVAQAAASTERSEAEKKAEAEQKARAQNEAKAKAGQSEKSDDKGADAKAKAEKAVSEARKLSKAGKYAEARSKVQEAITADPAYTVAATAAAEIDRAESEARQKAAAKAQADAAAKAKAEEAKARQEAERKAAEEKAAAQKQAAAQKAAEARAKKEAEDRAAAEKAAAEKAVAAQKAADAKAKKDAEQRAAAEKAAAEKAKKEADQRTAAEKAAADKAAASQKAAEVKAKKEAEQRAAAEKAAADKAAAERKAAEAKAKKDAEQRAAAEKAAADKAAADRKAAEAKAKKEADQRAAAEKAAADKAAAAQKAAEAKAKKDAEQRAAAEKAAAEQQAAANKAAEAKAKKGAEQKAAAEKAAAEKAARDAKAAAEASLTEARKLAKAGKLAEARAKAEAAASGEGLQPKVDEFLKGLAKQEADQKERDAKAAAAKQAEAEKKAAAAKQAETKARATETVAKANKSLKDKNYAEAKAQAQAALADDASNPEAKKIIERADKELAKSARSQSAAPAAELQPLAASRTTPGENPVAKADELVRDAQKAMLAGNKKAALEAYRRAVALDSTNVEAAARLRELEGGASTGASGGGVVPPLPGTSVAAAETSAAAPAPAPRAVSAPDFAPVSRSRGAEEAQANFQKGLAAYQTGRLDAAVQYWNQALSLDPGNADAQRYLQQTRAEYEAYVRQNQSAAVRVQKSARATEKLSTPVTYDTAGEKSIAEFLSAMSLIADISFSVAPGVDPDVRVTAKLDEVPLKDALDIVLLPIGVKWNRAGDVVTVSPDLKSKFFNLTAEQVAKLKPLLEKKTLQKYLYGPEGIPTMRSTELLLDETNSTLLVSDSQENINKVEAYLKDLQTVAPSGLQYKNFKIKPEEGQRIRALVEAIVRTQSDAPYDLERRVLVDKDDLIVKDTAENIAKIEQLLLDKNFLKKLETQKLGVQTYNLTPKEPIGDNIEQVREMANNIVTVVKTILYAQSTESAAAAEGRRYFYDPNTLQLTITDFPDNLRAVSDYVRSLPQLTGARRRSEIIYLKHQTASELADLLNRVLGLQANGTNSASANQQAGSRILNVRPGNQEFRFGELSIVCRRITAGTNGTETEDQVELSIRTGTASQQQTIRELESVFIEDYELIARDIRPGTSPDTGTARLEVRFVPQGGVGGVNQNNNNNQNGQNGQGQNGQNGNQNQNQQTQTASEDAGIQIDTIDNLNALLIRYEDPAQVAEIRSWIEQLDTPILQVSIETKLVEVNETRAKEWMPDFNILNLSQGDVQSANVDTRFAQTQDSIQSPFDPFANDFSQGVPMMRGNTVVSLLGTAGDTGLQFNLRMLEQEGIVNSVSGPHVLVENGGTAQFIIEKVFPRNIVPGFNTLAGQNNQNNQNQNAQSQTNQILRQVDMQLTPQVTQLGEIRLDIQNLELNDLVAALADSFITNTTQGQGAPGAQQVLTVANDPTSPEGDQQVYYNSARDFVRRRRSLITTARVGNGGTIVLGGWTGETTRNIESGVPVLRNLPYVGKLLFNRTSDKIDKTNLLIFLTCNIVNP